jgi:hypothetical protein
MAELPNRGLAPERGYRFEVLVARLLGEHGFKVQSSLPVTLEDRRLRIEVDLLLTAENGAKTVVEVKLYRSRAPNPLDVNRACERLSAARAALNADHAMLVCNLPRKQMPNEADLPGGVILLPFDDLISLSKSDVELFGALIELERELNSSLRDFDRPIELASGRDPSDASSALSSLGLVVERPGGPPPPPPRRGHDLAQELLEIPAGKGKRVTLTSGRSAVPWALFEEVCLEALKYIFEDILDRWQKQKAVAGEANRFDAVAKITGDDVFSRTLIEDFSSRYVLFEFKNYSERVRPNLVHITEKYLFPKALRATAIMISPKGLHPDATSATHGALRDAGKLVLDLKVEHLCDMLEAKDNGTTPSAAMERLLDEFLLAVGR